MPESGADQHHNRVPIWKAADNPGSAANLFHDALETVICPDVINFPKLHNCQLSVSHYNNWGQASFEFLVRC